jgi:2-amino-4-hydroxy-6-hydroxymethyldihydropteridine diphosphokinase
MAESTIILALGSNLGDRFVHLQNAVRSLESFMFIDDVSSIYETPPFEMTASQDFLNICIMGKTDFDPFKFLGKCKEIETNQGRSKDEGKMGFQSRPIDIDILFYGSEIISSEVLKIPHPELTRRNFVLNPLNDIAPDYIHPEVKKPISLLLTELADNSKIKRIAQQILRNK